MNLKKLLIILILNFFNLAFSQNGSRDEIRLQKFIKSKQYDSIHTLMDQQRLNYEPTMLLCKKYLNPSTDNKIKSLGKYYEAIALYDHGDFQLLEKRIISYLNDASTDADLKCKILQLLFYVEKRLGNINKGIEYFQKFGNNCKEDDLLIHYAAAKLYLKEYESAIQYLNDYKRYFVTEIKETEIHSEQAKKVAYANIYNSLGDAYLEWYIDKKVPAYLDSAEVNFTKVYDIMKSDRVLEHDSRGNYLFKKGKIAFLRDDIQSALKYYKQCISFEGYKKSELDIAFADCYTQLNKPDSAIVYLEKMMKSPNIHHNKKDLIYVYHLLRQNYEKKGQSSLAYQYAKLCLLETESFTKNNKLASQKLYNIELKKIEKDAREMITIKEKQRKILIICIVLICCIGLGILYYQLNKRKKIEKQLNELIQKVENNENEEIRNEQQIKNLTIISNEKEIEIITKLLDLEKEMFFLSNEFSSTTVAKRIGTNTAYLSQTINKCMKKTFSEYSNELRINYILKELSENRKIRNYTSQALAEMIGYKNGSSFARSFKEKTGVTPFQYIEKLNKNSGNQNI